MKEIADQLQRLIDGYLPQLNAIAESNFNHKPRPEKWSKKEIIGHLIDSAHNNIRRFIVAQYENNPTIVYRQDDWVKLNNYQDCDKNDIISLWFLLNKQLCNILRSITDENSKLTCRSEQEHTLRWLAEDYITHLKHHIHTGLNLDPVAYP